MMNVPQRVSYHLTYEEAVQALAWRESSVLTILPLSGWHKGTKKLGVLTEGQDKVVEG
jgi:hypothetical protein